MSKISRKVNKRLAARIKGYEAACAIAEARKSGSSKVFRMPGSRNPKGR